MKKITTPHDRYFRAAMSDLRVAKDLLRHHLSKKLLTLMNLNTLKLCKESYIDKKLKLGITDILYSVSIKEQKGYIYILVEHQSSPDKWMALRVLKYQCEIMEQNKVDGVLPIVIPLVFYHGKEPYSCSNDIIDLFENKELAEQYLFKPFQLIDMNAIEDQEIRQYKWAGIMEFFTKHIFVRDILPYIKEMLEHMRRLEEKGGEDYIIRTIRYLCTAANIPNQKEFVETIREGLIKPGEDIMTFEQFCINEGMQKGMQEGRQEGRHQSKQEIAEKLLIRGHSTAEISDITGLSIPEIMNLQTTVEEIL